MSTVLSSLLTQLNDARVRDLAWALASPNLLTDSALAPSDTWYQNVLQDYLPRLLALDQAPEVLYLHLDLHCAAQRRLGLYFESLWHFYLLDSPRFQVLAHDWQQVLAGTTLGAFDFLVWDRQSQRIEHWELAIKFYLISQQEDAFDHAFGINPRDKLRRKHQHMLNAQLALSEHPYVASKLAELGLLPQYKRLILKGRLYYPAETQHVISERVISESVISERSERGQWGTAPPSTTFIAQHKLGWMTGSRASTDRRQNFVDPQGNWYMQVSEAWLASTKTMTRA